MRPQISTLPPIVAFAAVALVVSALRGLEAPRTPIHNAFGQGSTVVLVHGLGSHPECWLPTARHLARNHRVVLVELPGHGDSPMPFPFSLESAVQALDQAVASESRQPVVLVGHSIGGLVGACEALEHPERVRALVLVETALRPQAAGPERDRMLQAVDHGYQGLLRSAYTDFGRDSVQGEALYAEVAAQDSASIKRWIRLALTADLSMRIARLRCPALVVLAPRSWPADQTWRQTAQELGYLRVPRIEAVRIEDCGHFVMLDQPAELAQVIDRFIAHPDGESIAGDRPLSLKRL